MALIQCPECGGQLSSLAESCPHCGMPRKKVEPLPPPKPTYSGAKKSSSTLTFVKVMLGFFVVIMVISIFNGKDKDEPKPDTNTQNSAANTAPPEPAVSEKSAQQKDAECKQSLQCWGDKYVAFAGVYCKDDIEKLAQFSAKWTDTGWLESKFSRLKWLNKDQGTVTFIGDKVQFQNGFGAYQNYIYECDYDPQLKKVLDVRARPGRI